MRVDLSTFNNSWYNPGRDFLTRTFWHYVNAIFLQNPLNPSSRLKIIVLRLFGAKNRHRCGACYFSNNPLFSIRSRYAARKQLINVFT